MASTGASVAGAAESAGLGERLRPYRAVLASRARSQRTYRTSFALDLGSSALVGLVELAEVWVLFSNVSALGGMRFNQILLVFGLADLTSPWPTFPSATSTPCRTSCGPERWTSSTCVRSPSCCS